MSILALDLGTKTGFAYRGRGGIVSGTQDFTPSRYDSSAMRFVRFREFLEKLHEVEPIEHVAYEEVRRHRGVDAAHAYGGFMAQLLTWCEDKDVPAEAYPVGAIKKFWTGKGNAGKDAMIEGAAKRGFDVADDNEADALAILHMCIGESVLVD